MRVSLLDRARIRADESDADAVRRTVERAVRAESLGLHRFWTAEHHAVPGIAAAAPAVLLGAIGSRTARIRLGTGGIMLPNHAPLVVAEQALLLEALFPGRVDLGLGGSLGFTPPVRRALGRTSLRDDEYAGLIREVRAFLDGSAAITARPQVPPPPVLLLAIKDGLSLAADLGLPAVIGGPLLRESAAWEAYVRDFRPSAATPRPQVIVSVEVVVADTETRAHDLLLPEAWAMAHTREVGEFRPLLPVEEARHRLERASQRTREAAGAWASGSIAGTPDAVAERLRDLLERTGADELMATVSTFDPDDVAATDTFLSSLSSA